VKAPIMDLHIPAVDVFAMDQQRSRQAAVVPFKTEDIKDVHESSKVGRVIYDDR